MEKIGYLNFIDHTIELEEKFLPKFLEGTSQHLCEKLGMRREDLFREFVSFVNDVDGNPIYENGGLFLLNLR